MREGRRRAPTSRTTICGPSSGSCPRMRAGWRCSNRRCTRRGGRSRSPSPSPSPVKGEGTVSTWWLGRPGFLRSSSFPQRPQWRRSHRATSISSRVGSLLAAMFPSYSGLIVAQLHHVVVGVVHVQGGPVPMRAPAWARPGLDVDAQSLELALELVQVRRLDDHAEVVLVAGGVPANGCHVRGGEEINNSVVIEPDRGEAYRTCLELFHPLRLEAQYLRVKVQRLLDIPHSQDDVIHLSYLDQGLELYRDLLLRARCHCTPPHRCSRCFQESQQRGAVYCSPWGLSNFPHWTDPRGRRGM